MLPRGSFQSFEQRQVLSFTVQVKIFLKLTPGFTPRTSWVILSSFPTKSARGRHEQDLRLAEDAVAAAEVVEVEVVEDQGSLDGMIVTMMCLTPHPTQEAATLTRWTFELEERRSHCRTERL